MIHQKLLLFVSMLLCCSMAFSQERTITGTITDETNKGPVAGATVKVKGGNTAVSTNSEGVFAIKAPGGAVTLVISSIGYATKEVSVGAGSDGVTIVLSGDSKQLGE